MATSMQPPQFTAPIGYLGPMSEYPIFHSGYPHAENVTVDWREMPIHNARQIEGGATLAAHGFAVIDHPSGVRDFGNRGEIDAVYPQEIVDVVKKLTGASEVLVSAAGIASRHSDRHGLVVAGAERAARFCHNDFTPGSTGIHIATKYPHVKPGRLQGRIAAYNVWRCISPPPQDMPLVLCDPRSVQAADVVTGEARYGDPSAYGVWGEVCLFRHNPAHRWFYFPNLDRAEILLFTGYDSDPAFPSIVPHTAVEDPTCPQETPPRWNLDCRCFALFDG